MKTMSMCRALTICLVVLLICHKSDGQDHAAKHDLRAANVKSELDRFAKSWDRLGWNQPEGRRQYLWSLDDDSWQQRIEFLQMVAAGDEKTVADLVETLNDENEGKRILAAQALGFCTAAIPVDVLIDKIKNDSSSAVKLYLIDALGMHGVTNIENLLGEWQPRDRDVRMHLSYAKERNGTKVKPEIVETLRHWDPANVSTARVGQPAPDFELENLTGSQIRLSDFQGERSVVLVFIYGDT